MLVPLLLGEGPKQSVGQVGLGSRDHLDVLGIDEVQLERPVLEHQVGFLPAGRFLHHLDDPVGREAIGQLLQFDVNAGITAARPAGLSPTAAAFVRTPPPRSCR
jgi:hypothetical protein